MNNNTNKNPSNFLKENLKKLIEGGTIENQKQSNREVLEGFLLLEDLQELCELAEGKWLEEKGTLDNQVNYLENCPDDERFDLELDIEWRTVYTNNAKSRLEQFLKLKENTRVLLKIESRWTTPREDWLIELDREQIKILYMDKHKQYASLREEIYNKVWVC